MKYIIPGLILSLSLSLSQAQNPSEKLWSKSEEASIQRTGVRQIVPNKYKTLKIVPSELKARLFSAPDEKTTSIYESSCIISLPVPDGSLQRFWVVDSPIMQESLAQSFPDMKTFSVRGIDDVNATGKLDWNEFGFHGMVLSPKGDFFIDPYCVGNITDYITYYTSDFVKPAWQIIPEVGVIRSEENKENNDQRKPSPSGAQSQAHKESATAAVCVGAQLRTYRLAVACTGEYAKAATGQASPTNAQTLAKVVTTVNRVDGVYETEVSVRLILVSTTTLALYTNTNTASAIAPAPSATSQPFTGNNSAGTLINESQNVITTLVGSANFDIGHTFSTGAGGLANLGCVCKATEKGRGITGASSPVGDPYDIDYVAHEMGHQFGGDHTFNCGTGSCSGNRNGSTAMEPGSGVTIMAYAGICGNSDNLELHSIPYFHGVSYDQIVNYTNSGLGNGCAVLVTSSNHAPVVSALTNYVVPKSTPFYLTGSATDQDGDALTYSWEEMDAGTTTASWNSGAKPYFRSYAPVTNPTRFFPTASVAASGNFSSVKGEYVPPHVATLKFRLTARDGKMGGGGVCSSSCTVTVDTSGPLKVTYPNLGGISWPTNTQKVVAWDVNGTNAAPVSCDSVRIMISDNSGSTFSVLINSTPNDGSELVNVPFVTNNINTCRIKIQSIGNVFYDIGNSNFAITTDAETDVGLMKLSASSQIAMNIWPNPFNNEISLIVSNLNSRETTEVEIVDVLGKTVQKTTYTNKTELRESLDVSSLNRGIYFVKVNNNNKQSVYRILKN